MITVRPIPARPPRSARLARRLGLDRNPLRRGTDRVLAWIRIGMVVAFLAGGTLGGIAAGQWMYHAATAESRIQAAERHSVAAVLLQSTPPPVFTMGATHWGSQAWVMARWTAAGGAPRTGDVLADPGLRTGSHVTVWLDSSGRPTLPPLQLAQITDRTVAAAIAAPSLLAFVLVIALWVARWIADRRRLAAWDEAWMSVGPDWTRRGP